MRPISFNDGWTVRHVEEDGPGTAVRLPHDAMLSEPRSGQAEGGTNTGWFAGADYLYTKTFSFDPAWAGKRLILELEGIYRNAEIYLNGRKAAFRPYGYTNFYVPLNCFLRPGENTLEVVARNADQPNSRWYTGAGIYRPVWLWVGPEAYIPPNGVRIRTLSLDPARVEVTVRASQPGQVRVEILDGGSLIASGAGEERIELTIPNARPWSPEEPQLYTCRVTFGEDSWEGTFGLRTLEWGEDGLLLNGRRILLRGACVHHDLGLLGAACWQDGEDRRVRLLKEAGYNALRSAHNPCSKALLSACDRLGMLVMDEYIDHWYIHKTQYDYVPYFDSWYCQDLTDLVDKDYNHPSVILYSTGNEVSETAQPRGAALAGELTELLHRLDPTRPVTCGVNLFFNYLSSLGFGVYSDEKARKEAARAEKRKSGAPKKKKAVGSQFFNDLAGLLGADFMKMGAALPGSDAKTRDAFALMDVAGYNYGIRRYQKDLKKYPRRLILGTETFCQDAWEFYELAKNQPRLLGDFVWTGMDYLGEVGIGAWEYRAYAPDFSHGPGWIAAGSGRLDLTGRAWAEMAYTRVAMGLEDGPRIGVRPVCFSGQPHSPSAWRMTDAMESWSWRGCEGKMAQVEVYARAPSVALFLNSRPVGKKVKGKNGRFSFHIPYENGTLESVSLDENGREIGRTALKTAGDELFLRVEPEEASVRPGHLVYFRLRYTDGAGVLQPMARGSLRLQVKGGVLLAAGSASPYYPGSYLEPAAETYYGEALAIIQAGEGEKVLLTATDGTRTAQGTIPVRSCGTDN